MLFRMVSSLAEGSLGASYMQVLNNGTLVQSVLAAQMPSQWASSAKYWLFMPPRFVSYRRLEEWTSSPRRAAVGNASFANGLGVNSVSSWAESTSLLM